MVGGELRLGGVNGQRWVEKVGGCCKRPGRSHHQLGLNWFDNIRDKRKDYNNQIVILMTFCSLKGCMSFIPLSIPNSGS